MGRAPSRPLGCAGGGRLKAAAHIVAESVDGHTVYRTLRAEAPMALRRVDDAVFVISSAAHPVGGDELVVGIDVGPGAHVVVRSVAAMLVWPGPAGESSTLRYEVSVAAGGRVDVAPEPTVAVRGCRHLNEVVVDLESDAALRWREEIVLGRTGEEPGRVESTIRVFRSGIPVLATGTRVGGEVVEWSGPAVMVGHRRLVTEVRVDDDTWAAGEDRSAFAVADGLFARHRPVPGVVIESTVGGGQPSS